MAGVLSLSLASCSAPPGDGADGAPDFGGTAPGNTTPGTTVATPSGTTVATPSGSTGNGVTPTSPGEQNPASNAPIAGANTGSANNGAGGTGATGGTDNPGAAGSSMGVAGAGMGFAGTTSTEPVQPPPPVAPGDPSPEEITTFFASLPCGAKYTALGDGSYSACVRLQGGGAACTKTSADFTRVTFDGGAPLTDVTQVSGMGENAIGVVTTSGALHIGNSPTTISRTPLIASGVVNISGGREARVALVTNGSNFAIQGWRGESAPNLLTLPDGEQPIQVSANYGLACALSTSGSVFCWAQGGNVSIQGLGAQASPVAVDLGAPVRLVSAGQDTLCGVTFDDTLTCVGNFNASPYLPTQRVGGDILLLPDTFPSVREVHAAFHQGTVVSTDGAAFFLPGVGAGENNPGMPFAGASDVIASGGDRGTSCVLTAGGEVFCMFGATGGPSQRATIDGAPLVAQAAACPL